MSGRKYIVFAAAAFLLCVSILCVVIMTNFQRLSPLERVSDRITSIEEEYVDENGYIAIENAPELIDAVYKEVRTSSEVSHCEKHDFSVYMILENGIGFHYVAPVAGLANSGNDIAIYTYQPHYNLFYDECDMLVGSGLSARWKCIEYPNDAVETLENLSITDASANAYYDDDVTIEMLKTLAGDSVIIWVGHGGYSDVYHSHLTTNFKFTDVFYENYKEDFDSHRLEVCKLHYVYYVCVTAAFFDYYLAENALDNSVVYLASCCSGQDDVLVDVFLEKGASAVYSNSDALYQSYNNKMCRSITNYLCDGFTTGEALKLAQEDNGERDNALWGLISRDVRVLCSGDTNLTLEDIYDRIGAEDSNDDAEDFFDETYWAMSFGQSLGYNYAAKFSADGTFVARGLGSGAYENGTYTYSNGKLVIVFDIDGFGYPSKIEYSGDENGFTSLDEYPMQVGKGHYHISPDNRSAEYFNEGLNDNLALSDGEYYGLLNTWDSKSMTIELLEYAGRSEQSNNYILNPTGQVITLDISQAQVYLESVWLHTYGDTVCASIDAALDTEIWGGETTVREQCSMQIYFVIENTMVQRIVILYAA